MSNKHISIGIDLGTTNSAVTVNYNEQFTAVKNQHSDEYTPSVFGADKGGNKIVGKKAYERLYKETSLEEVKNNKAEVKRIMGVDKQIEFPRLKTTYSPEEISAEILNSLKQDVARKYPDKDTSSAVITIPAAFSTLQSEATKKAGKIAGFDYVVLLQEPIAAAMAYGFNSKEDGNWLIYDLGGGTFDVAVVSSNDGRLSVLGHEGNNFLGGKNIDAEIIDKIIVPKIMAKFNITNFNRNSERFLAAFANLKSKAEEAKIELSHLDSVRIEIDKIGLDDEGKEIYCDFNISRTEFEKIIKPLVDESIELAKKSIKDTGLDNSQIKRIILIGGPTQMPLVRNSLEKELGIEVDASQDPLTAVSRGACIYGLSQTVPDDKIKNDAVPHETIIIDLNYDALTSDLEEVVSGKIAKLNDIKEEEFFLQIQSDSGSYSGNKLDLKGGKFVTDVSLDKNKQNKFWLYLFDKRGNQLKSSPESFTITQGVSVRNTSINHSFRIIVQERSAEDGYKKHYVAELLFDKNTSLPCEKTETYRITDELVSDKENNELHIVVVEGENDMPDRNKFVCKLGIKGKDLPCNLPEGDKIEITIKVDESGGVFVNGYIPSIDLNANVRSTFKAENIVTQKLQDGLASQEVRIKNIDDGGQGNVPDSIKSKVKSIQSNIDNAAHDEDAKRQAESDLIELKNSLDELTSDKGIDEYKAEYRKLLDDAGGFLNQIDPKERATYNQELEGIKKDADSALISKDTQGMRRINEALATLNFKMIVATPKGMFGLLQALISRNPILAGNDDVKFYMDKANKGLQEDNLSEIMQAYFKILEFLPKSEQEDAQDAMRVVGIKRYNS